MKKFLSVIIILATICSFSAPAFAAGVDGNWVGGTSADWTDGTNWSSTPVAPSGNATFDAASGVGGAVINLGAGHAATIGSVIFNLAACDSYTIGAAPAGTDTLTLANGGGIVVNNGVVKTQTIQSKINLSPNATFSNNGANDAFLLNVTGNITGGATNGTLTLNGSDTGNNTVSGNILAGAAALGVTKSEAGTWTLSGTNTYTGGTILNAGTLNINSTTALGATAGTFTINGGKIDNTSGGVTLANNNAQIWNADFTFIGTNNLNLGTGAVTLGANVTVTSSTNPQTLTVGGNIGDGGNSRTLSKDGLGLLVLNGNNTYGGLTTVSSGTLTLAGDNRGAAGGISLLGGELDINSVYALGTGTLSITTITIDNSSGGALTLLTNNTQTWNGNFGFKGTKDLNLGTGAVNLGAATRKISITAGTLTVGGAISGTGGLERFAGGAAGELVLSGNNTYSGLTTVSTGILTLSGDNAGASGGVTLTAGTLNINSATALGTGTFTITTGTIDNTSAADVTVSTGNAQNWNGNFAYTGGTRSLNLGTGAVTLGATPIITVNGNTLTEGGVISGAHGITKAGTGTLALSGVNVYTGQTIIQDGVLSANSLNSVADLTGCSLGLPSGSVANGTIALGSVANTGQLTYTGGAVTTDRVINLAGTTGGGTIDQSGTGALKFTSNLTATGAGAKSLTLQGSTAGTGEISGAIVDNGGANRTSVVKAGTGTWTLSGANTYSGSTSINGGTLKIGGANNLGDASATNTISFNGGTLESTAGLTLVANRAITLAGAGTLQSDAGTLEVDGTITNGANLLTVTGSGNTWTKGIIGGGAGGLTKTGTGKLTLGAANTYTGTTTISGGTLEYGVANALLNGGVTVNNGGTYDWNSWADTIGALTVNDGGTTTCTGAGATLTTTTLNINSGTTGGSITTGSGKLTLGGNVTSTGGATNASIAGKLDLGGATRTFTVTNVADGLTVSAIINGVGAGDGVTKAGNGTLTLSSANTYTGATTINAGTVRVSNSSAFGGAAGGNVTNNATLDIGSTTLNIGGTYTQVTGATLMVAINGTSNGSIVATGTATVNTGALLTLAVSTTYIANGATYTIINGAAGGAVVAPTITVTGSNQATFTATTVGNNLVLTASRAANGFASSAPAGDSNASNVGTVLDTITNPSADMTTILNTMTGLSTSQQAAALNSMVPEVDAGVINTSTTTLNNFVGVAIDRVEGVLTIAKAADSSTTGMSAGDAAKVNGIWGKGYGSYLTQGTRNNIAGYDAWNAGTAIGVDHLFAECVTLGISGGYAYGNVDGDINNANTYINSAQTTIYGGYQDKNLPYFIDAAGSFAYNWYNGTRDIVVGPTITRTANAEYGGQQYGVYLGGGYKIDVAKNIEFTPLISLQWNHLRLNSYTETEAGALNLVAGSQEYDQLLSGLGARVATPMKFAWGTFTPEAHGKWFYDFIGDPFAVSSNFNGGGASFNSNGCKPALNSFNAGGQLIFDFKNDVSLIGNCDTEMKDQFFGIYGSVTVRYDF